MWSVDPLQRTCTELLLDEEKGLARSDQESAAVITVRDLAEIPVFVLLGEPGMGKSESMKALTVLVLGPEGRPIAANDFIVLPASSHDVGRQAFIDALDEARAGGDTTVWRELRRTIAQSGLARFGVSCRIADWLSTDAHDLATVTQGQRIRVFSLNPLTPEQRHAVLKNEDIEDINSFEERAQALGFSDMLGNPQSLKLLVASVKRNQSHWPETRRDANEMACKELVREVNLRHRQARKSLAPLGEEELYDAAGWLCALMLLSNQNEVADEALSIYQQHGVQLSEVLDALPTEGCSPEAIRQVLQRRLFTKPRGYAASHRTVAEYLAARYIAKRISQGRVLPARVAALMLASSQHLVSNLRGLAGWLASLSEPMRGALFLADPAAVLDYGDLLLLPKLAKQDLIEHLCVHPGTANLRNIWHKSAMYAPLVQADMVEYVTAWLSALQAKRPASPSQTVVAYVLLNALEHVPSNGQWVPPLLGLVRSDNVIIDLRDQALDALIKHSKPSEAIALVKELQLGTLGDKDGRLTGSLLRHLYPKHVSPAEALKFLTTHISTNQLTDFRMFWEHYLPELTPPELLTEFMEALEAASSKGQFVDFSTTGQIHRLDGLATIAVEAIALHGSRIPIAKLANWIKLCMDRDLSPFEHISPELTKRLGQWIKAHPEKIKAVLGHWVKLGESSWAAQHRILSVAGSFELGLFWLEQAKAWDASQDASKARDCLDTAFWWASQEDSDISLESLETAAALSNTLREALEPHLSSSLSEDNWRRKHWFQGKNHRAAQAAREELNEKNRTYLLDHLDEVRQGKLLDYLSDAAWADLSNHGYSGGLDTEKLLQWRKTHPELELATREGYRTLLDQLTETQANAAVSARQNGQILNVELPCLLAAYQMFSAKPDYLFNLGEERIKALVTLHLLNHISHHEWFLALLKSYPRWVEDVWWALCKRQLRSRNEVRVPQMGLLRHELSGTPIAARLLSQALEAWPSKFSELNFAEFAVLLEAVLCQCATTEVSRLLQRRLKRRSLGSLQRAYLLMAGLWVDHQTFAPQVQQSLTRNQIVQAELLGYVGHLRRYGGRSQTLPAWNVSTLDLLFRQLAPQCSPEHPVGSYSPGIKDDGREFLYQVLASFRNDTSESAQLALAALLQEASLSNWKRQLEEAAFRQTQACAEKAFAVPTPRQVALVLQNLAPANPTDLMAVALNVLSDLQREIHNNAFNLINSFWAVDENGKRPRPPHKPENACRDAIAQWLGPRLATMAITVLPELQHGDQKRSDLGFLVHNTGAPEMLLPIEVKGDWHDALWTAAHQQLGQQYTSDNRCLNQGIYLVLWMGDLKKLKQAPNHKVKSASELQLALQQQEDMRESTMRVQVVVLDLSISNH